MASLLVLATAILILDQMTKLWTYTSLPLATGTYPFGGIAVFHDFHGISFSLVHEMNTGAAWGFFANWSTALFVVRLLVIIGLFFYLIFGRHSMSVKIPLTLIIAGAFSNILDRFLYGAVIDMFYFQFGTYGYPVFNVADSAITIGIIWLVLRSFKGKKHRAKA